MEEYTLSLALVDYLPVLFSLIGMIFIVRMIHQLEESHRPLALVGIILIIGGGAMKATWKLIMALSNSQTNIVFMDDGLFVLMAPGFTLLAWAIWSGVRAVRDKSYPKPIWVVPVIIIVAFYGLAAFMATRGGRTWNLILLMQVTLANVAALIMLIAFSIREKMPIMAVLFGVNLVLTFVLSGMARVEEQTIALQWMEESVNTVAWLAFAFAAWNVYQYTQTRFSNQMSAEPATA